MSSEEKEEPKSATFTAALGSFLGIGSGKILGFKQDNFLEGVGFAALAGVIIGFSPLITSAKFIIGAIYCIAIFVVNIIGLRGQDLLGYIIGAVKRRRGGSVYVISPPVLLSDEQIEAAKRAETEAVEKKDETPVKRAHGRADDSKRKSLLERMADRLEE